MNIKKFKYKPRLGLFLICFATFLAMSILILYIAQQPVRSHSIGRLMVRMNLDAALILNILGWIGIAFSAAAAYAVYWTKTLGERHVEIGAGRIRAPASNLSANIVEVPFSEIQNVSVQKIQSSRIITVQHAKGKMRFTNMMFPEKGAFDELISALNDISNTQIETENVSNS